MEGGGARWSGDLQAALRGMGCRNLADRMSAYQPKSPLGLGSMVSTLHGPVRTWRLRGAKAGKPFGTVRLRLTLSLEPQPGLSRAGGVLPNEL